MSNIKYDDTDYLINREESIEYKTQVMNKSYEEFMKQFVPKQKVKDKIEELKLSGGSNGKDNVENLARELVIEALEELLEEK